MLGEAAAAAARTNIFRGERHWRPVKRRGKLDALVAIARTILVIWYQARWTNTRRLRPFRRCRRL
jgi:transposase